MNLGMLAITTASVMYIVVCVSCIKQKIIHMLLCGFLMQWPMWDYYGTN